MTLPEAQQREAELLVNTFLKHYTPVDKCDLATFTAQTPRCDLGKLKYVEDPGLGGEHIWTTKDKQVKIMVNGYSGKITSVFFD